MHTSLWRGGLLLLALLLALPGMTVCAPNLSAYLQSEVNTIATLNAQAGALRQQGDTLGANLLVSYIPEHQRLVNVLSAAVTCQGVNPGCFTAQVQPFCGSRDALLLYDLNATNQALANYRQLLCSADANVQQIGLLGVNGASRQFASLVVARSTTGCADQASALNGLLASLALERGAIADLQAQSAQLRALGDVQNANLLASFIPRHQQQAANLEAAIGQLGGNVALAVPAQPVTYASINDIIAHENIVNTQMASTYAIPVAMLTPGTPMYAVALQGYNNGQTNLAALPRVAA